MLKTILVPTILSLSIFTMPLCAVADEKMIGSDITSISEAEEENDTTKNRQREAEDLMEESFDGEEEDGGTKSLIIEGGNIEVSELQTQMDYYAEEVEEIKAAIKVYEDTDKLLSKDEGSIRSTRRRYHALPDAYKIQVGNIKALKKAEKALNITYADGELDEADNGVDPVEKTGEDYTFELTQGITSASINIRYLTDDDNDGSLDAPSLNLITPEERKIQIPDETNNINSTFGTVSVSRTNDYMQLDLTDGESGIWRLEASNMCNFTLLENMIAPTDMESDEDGEPVEGGSNNYDEDDEISEIEAIDEETEESVLQEHNTLNTMGNITSFLPMILLGIGLIMFFAVIKPRMMEGTSGRAKAPKEKKSRTSEKDENNNVIDDNELEELRKYAKSLEASTEQRMQKEEINEAQPKQEHMDEDEDLEEYDEYPSEPLSNVRKEISKDEEDTPMKQTDEYDDMF